MSEIIELVEKASGQMEQLEGDTSTAREAVDQLAQRIESLSRELETDWEALSARVAALAAKAGNAEETLRNKGESVNQVLTRLAEHASTVQGEMEAAAQKTRGAVDQLAEQVDGLSGTTKEGFEAVEQQFQEAGAKFQSIGEQMTAEREDLLTHVNGEVSATLQEVLESSRTGIEQMVSYLGDTFLPALAAEGEELTVTLSTAADQAEERCHAIGEEAATGAREAVEGLAENANETVRRITTAVDEAGELMNRMADFFGESAQGISKVMEAMSEASSTTATGITTVTGILDNLREIFHGVCD